MRMLVIALISLVLIGLVACSGALPIEEDPRKAVIKFFGAMESNDSTAIAHYLDFKTLMSPQGTDYALSTEDEPRIFNSPQDVINDLVDGGLTKQRWFSMQRVIGNATENNDSALVEVSFINKSTDVQYFTKFGLKRINDQWKIYSFNSK